MFERVYIVGALRSPIGKFRGSLSSFTPDELSAVLIKGLLAKTGLKPTDIDQVHLGCIGHCEAKELLAPVIARQALLKAGLPETVISSTIERACTSSTFAMKIGFDAIRLGEASVVIAGGCEIMSRVPHVLRELRTGVRLGNIAFEDPLYRMGNVDYNPVSVDAGVVALEYGVSREQQDEWAYLSQMKHREAKKAGKWEDEILPIEAKMKDETVIFDADEFPRPNTTLEKLATLKTVYGSPTVTAGNAPGINDGAAAMVLIGESKMNELGIEPLAELVDFQFVADRYQYIPIVPGKAIKALLEKRGLSVDDLECMEINEAFAAVPLVSSIILGDNDEEKIAKIREKLNVNGGSVAMGHPPGCSGARIVVTLLHELRRRGGGYGAAAICGGLAQGDAVLIKV